MGSYVTVLTERGGGVVTVMREMRDELNTDELTGRRDDTLLQGMATIITAAKEAEEEEDVIMRVILLQLIDTAVSAFNLAFLIVMKTAATL
ncbi:hypothetical protein BDBG_06643 [Blastomyces gilchristii SLH14081]|uniref:Uncharacterized protein n=1 Tax=Blastomyces gilchristii (strain SLH14081) TaxID=559298 RepID=A0A179URY8_BLAGS|nr:uncharacterized protein BDBG_06643 [Blastomyces gilchristii SLH14081]OAT10856.1 hypothetical protein BDBG_06643 [Blastomyces gilchristii SLH14081]